MQKKIKIIRLLKKYIIFNKKNISVYIGGNNNRVIVLPKISLWHILL